MTTNIPRICFDKYIKEVGPVICKVCAKEIKTETIPTSKQMGFVCHDCVDEIKKGKTK